MFFTTSVKIYLWSKSEIKNFLLATLPNLLICFSRPPLLKSKEQHQYLSKSFNVFLVFITLVFIIITFMEIFLAYETEW